MRLFLIRHAATCARTARGDDEARALTPKGARRWRRAVRGLRALRIRFDRLYHGPWRRAVETAELAAKLVDGECVVTSALARAPSPTLLREIEGERVALVGHQPWLGELCALLTLGRAAEGRRFVLGKGTVIELEGQLRAGGMVVRAILPSRVLRSTRR